MLSRFPLLLAGSTVFLVPQSVCGQNPREAPLSIDQFRATPREFGPELWWHWLNGNIDAQALGQDLAWMDSIGIGGVHIFDVALPAPRIVASPLRYMSEPWKQAFRGAVRDARARGMRVGIAASPGWSESGGPWVSPIDAMKKVTWSILDVKGGRLRLRLPRPPATVGPLLDAPAAADPFAADHAPIPALYRDVRLLAVRLRHRPNALSAPLVSHDGDGEIAKSLLTDGSLAGTITLPSNLSWIEYRYPHPVTIRSAVLGRTAGTAIAPIIMAPTLEADSGAGFHTVAAFESGNAPQQTLSFPPVTAARFRLRFDPTAPLGPPRAISEWRLSSDQQVNRFEDKAGFDQAIDYRAIPSPSFPGVAPEEVVDITDHMTGDGRIDWRVPSGRWRLIRLGWSLTGKVNHPAVPEATGLEVDKLDPGAVGRYTREYLRRMAQAAPLGLTGVGALTSDSIEVGAQNWTGRLIEEFRSRRGYDPTSYLPTLTGMIVGDGSRSDAFLYDLRRTLGELVAEAHYKTLAEVAREQSLTSYVEAMEFARTIQGDDMDMRRYADIPMAAMWSFSQSAGPDKTALADMRGAASIAHLQKKPDVAAELLTSMDSLWRFSPADLRPMIDRAFAAGITRPIIHSSVHQPRDSGEPGLTLGVFGQTFNRTEIWARLAAPWISYIARSTYLLRQGEPAADLLYAYGEDAPLVSLYGGGLPPDLPQGNGWDFIDNRSLLADLSVRDGRLTTGAGASYRLLWLGGTSRRMTLPSLRAIARLVAAGGHVAGPRPTGSPSLADDPVEVRRLIETLWDKSRSAAQRGYVDDSASPTEALARIGVRPVFRAASDDVQFVQRKLPGRDLFYIVNSGSTPLATVTTRGVVGCPSLWRATDGHVEPAEVTDVNDDRQIRIDLAPGHSIFLLFDRTEAVGPAGCPKSSPDKSTGEKVIADGWTLSFPDAPAHDALLGSWTDQPDAEHRYFSGTATYARSIRLGASDLVRGRKVMLDLGQVGDIAQVKVNGKEAGIIWTAPWCIDLTPFARKGANRIEINVTNLWQNRLVGNAIAGSAQFGFTATTPLRPSGLLGPVSLRFMRPSSNVE